MKTIITYGSFDLFHFGHLEILRRAKELGDKLIVGLSTDEFNWNEKQKKSFHPYAVRKANLEAIRYVDMVIPEKDWLQKELDVQQYDVDVFVIGDDWINKFDFLQEYCRVVYLPRTPDISSSLIKSLNISSL